MTDVSVVICTYNRPDLLLKAVRSCVALEVEASLEYEIIVVDNSADGNAQASIGSVASTSAVTVRYLSEPRTNISHARNCGVAAAKGRYVAFLDDDEQASPGWLQALFDVCRAYGADMVAGPVEPVFASGHAPSWDPQAKYYRRDRGLETGAVVTSVVGAGNLLIDATTCLQGDEPFNPDFGRTGGEDTDYFMRMHALGRKVIWCAEALVTEYQPHVRESLDYFVGRTYRHAQVYYRCRIANSSRPFAAKLYALTAGTLQLAVWLLPWLLTFPFESALSVKYRFRIASSLGKLTWWRPRPHF